MPYTSYTKYNYVWTTVFLMNEFNGLTQFSGVASLLNWLRNALMTREYRWKKFLPKISFGFNWCEKCKKNCAHINKLLWIKWLHSFWHLNIASLIWLTSHNLFKCVNIIRVLIVIVFMCSVRTQTHKVKKI